MAGFVFSPVNKDISIIIQTYYHDYYIVSTSCRILVLKLVLFRVYQESNVIEEFYTKLFLQQMSTLHLSNDIIQIPCMKTVLFLISIHRYGITLPSVKPILAYVTFDHKLVFIVRFST